MGCVYNKSVPGPYSYECLCLPGYIPADNGNGCKSTCYNPDYCQHGGRCNINNGSKVCDCRGTGHHGQTCSIKDCIGFECPDDYHCESNPFNPNVPSCICNYDF